MFHVKPSPLYDVAIVGAGPAGINATAEASKNGLKTILIDKAKFPRAKTCGGGLVPLIDTLVPFPVHSVVERAYNEVIVTFSKPNKLISISKSNNIIRTVNRKVFDDFLLRNTLDFYKPVFYDQCELLNVSTGTNFTLITSKGKIRAQFVIAADGALSKTKKAILQTRNNVFLAPAIEYAMPAEKYPCEEPLLRFDIGRPPGGYAWCFPKNGYYSIGLGCFSPKRLKVNLKNELLQYLSFLGFEEKIINTIKPQGSVIPLADYNNVLYNNNALFAGDSAGFADPITAEGISNALLSGTLAARSIAQAGLNPSIVSKLYVSAVYEKILKSNNTKKLLSNLLYGDSLIKNLSIKYMGRKIANSYTDTFTGSRKLPSNNFELGLSAIKMLFR